MAGFFERLFDSNARELKAIENKVALVERYADEMAASVMKSLRPRRRTLRKSWLTDGLWMTFFRRLLRLSEKQLRESSVNIRSMSS